MTDSQLVADRSAISAALAALLADITWGPDARGFAYQSQRLQSVADCSGQPALYVCQGDERYEQRSGVLPPIRDLEHRVIVYQDVGRDTSHPRPAEENDLILGAIEARLLQDRTPDQRQTLGGRVHHCRIEGEIIKISGDMSDGQGVMLIPIWAMVP